MQNRHITRTPILRYAVSIAALYLANGCVPRSPTKTVGAPTSQATSVVKEPMPAAPKPDPTPRPNGSLAITVTDPGAPSQPLLHTFSLAVPKGKTASSFSVDLRLPASLPVAEITCGAVVGGTAGTKSASPHDEKWHRYSALKLDISLGSVGFALSLPASTKLSDAKFHADNFIVTYMDGSMDILRFDTGTDANVIATTSASGKATFATAIDSAIGSNPVALHGALKVVRNQILDQFGDPAQLKGMSLFWSQWSRPFWNAQVVHHLADSWNVDIVRAAMAVEKSNGGYLANPKQKDLLEKVVAAALAEGIYVIIDWHYSGNKIYTAEASAFFTEMATTYGQYPNVIFEIYNEPLDTNNWAELKVYSETVTQAIRAAGSTNLVLLPSPRWDQDLNFPAADPLDPAKFGNVAHTLHFYAGSHGKELRDVADAAIVKGLPIFVSEWGTSDSTGGSNHQVYLNESRTWLEWMDSHHLSSCNWSVFDKNESSCALVPGASKTGPWPDTQLTVSGKYVKGYINGVVQGEQPKP